MKACYFMVLVDCNNTATDTAQWLYLWYFSTPLYCLNAIFTYCGISMVLQSTGRNAMLLL